VPCGSCQGSTQWRVRDLPPQGPSVIRGDIGSYPGVMAAGEPNVSAVILCAGASSKFYFMATTRLECRVRR